MAGEQKGSDVDAALLAMIGVLGVILLVVIVLSAQAWFYYEQDREWARKVLDTPNHELQQLYTAQAANLKAGRDRIGLERAKELVVKRYAQERAAAPAPEAPPATPVAPAEQG